MAFLKYKMSFCFSVSFSFKIMNYIVYQCKTIKIHNLIRLRKFFLFPNFGSKEFEDSTLLPQSRNSKLDFFFFPYEWGKKSRWILNRMAFRTTRKEFLLSNVIWDSTIYTFLDYYLVALFYLPFLVVGSYPK